MSELKDIPEGQDLSSEEMESTKGGFMIQRNPAVKTFMLASPDEVSEDGLSKGDDGLVVDSNV